MDADETEDTDVIVSRIAGAIGEPARARMLSSLMDGRARTSTELALIGGVSPSTASVHLRRLTRDRLVHAVTQGRHHYFVLGGTSVARVLEALNVLAHDRRPAFVPTAPLRLRMARSCYDHMGGSLAVALHDQFIARRWLCAGTTGERAYDVTDEGVCLLAALGIDVAATRGMRRRFAYECLDWSERRPHLGGALGAAVFDVLTQRRWILLDDDSRALSVTAAGRRELHARFGVARELLVAT